MKYCKICKTTAKETDTVCAKGHALSVFGAASKESPKASPPGGPPPKREPAEPGAKPSVAMFTLMGEVQKLEEAKQKNIKRGRAFGLLSLAAALTIALILYQVYARTVLAYAVLENIQVEQDPMEEGKIQVSYDVTTPGKVAFDRQSGSKRYEKLDLIGETGRQGFWWILPSDSKTGINFHVRYRDGWLLKSFDRHFDVLFEQSPNR
jgi:hypothetical protein